MPEYTPFERRRRRVARASLYGSLVLVALGAAAFWTVITRPLANRGDTSWHDVTWENEPTVRLFRQFLRIDTGPGGDELAGALFLSTPLRAAGIGPEIVALGERHANLRVVLPGRSASQLLLLSHLDVEPVENPELWDHPPFSGAVSGPMVWGRGAFDMKSYTLAQLWSLLELARRPAPPERTVAFVATSEEERGSHLGLRWILWQRSEWFEDVWAVLTEGGLLEARSLEEPKYWAIEVGQRTVVSFEVCADSRERLEAFREDVRGTLRDLRRHPVVVTEAVRDFWEAYWPTRDRRELREILSEPARLERDFVAASRLPSYLLGLVSNELGVGEIEPAPGGGWKMLAALVLVPGADVPAAVDSFFPPWLTGGVSVTRIEGEDLGGVSPVDHAAFQTLQQLLRRHHPESPVGPFVLAATLTDARFLRSRGIPVYGFTPFFMLTPETLRAANSNEKVPLPAFVRGVELYVEAVTELAE